MPMPWFTYDFHVIGTLMDYSKKIWKLHSQSWHLPEEMQTHISFGKGGNSIESAMFPEFFPQMPMHENCPRCSQRVHLTSSPKRDFFALASRTLPYSLVSFLSSFHSSPSPPRWCSPAPVRRLQAMTQVENVQRLRRRVVKGAQPTHHPWYKCHI